MRLIKSLSFLAAACLTFSFSFAQTADEIISKHVAAIGGGDNWKKVNSIVISESTTAQGLEILLIRTVLHNKGFRNEFRLMGMTGYQIVTPTEGWSFMPFNNQTSPEAMTADDIKESQNDLDAQNAFVDYAAKGSSVEYIGKEEVDGTECHKLKLTYKNGRTETAYIDPASYYVIKSTKVQKSNGQEIETTETFSNYEKLPEGIVIPKSISRTIGSGMNADFTVSKVEVNKAIDEAAFKPAK